MWKSGKFDLSNSDTMYKRFMTERYLLLSLTWSSNISHLVSHIKSGKKSTVGLISTPVLFIKNYAFYSSLEIYMVTGIHSFYGNWQIF